jgi:inosine-uridine nucleoside N-ribohydrolase
MPTKVILDTDIGSDIDDAVALAHLLARPDCELLGVTTVTGEAVERAKMVSAMCKVAGKDIPIYPGLETPMLVPQKQTKCPQAKALKKWPHEKKFPEGGAVEFLRRTIEANPGEVVLLTIAPLTNIGLLFATHPGISSKLKALVMMCGVFTNRLAGVGPCEWNAIGDPHATAIVYRAPVRVHRSVGLEVTCRVRMSADEVRRRFTAELLRPVRDFAEDWFAKRAEITFHDPLAAVAVFDEKVCRWERGAVEVELKSDRVAGMTHWKQDPSGPHEVALDVDPERFFDRYFAVFK